MFQSECQIVSLQYCLCTFSDGESKGYLMTSWMRTVFMDSSYITGYLVITSSSSMRLGIFSWIPATISSTIWWKEIGVFEAPLMEHIH